MPVEIDANEIVAAVNARTSAGLTVLGVASQGETGGAVYVLWPDGRKGVVTPSDASAADLRRMAEVLALAHDRGLPVPRYELIVTLESGAVVVQEFLPGEVTRLDVARLEAMVEVNEHFAGVLVDRPDVPIPELRLHSGSADPALERYSPRSRALLARIRDLSEGRLVGDDLLHLDYNSSNVLFDASGAITGVVDWGGSAARGDRRFALIKLRFDLEWGTLFPPGPDPALIARLDEILDAMIEPETLRFYWAEWSLRMLNWTIRNFRPDDVDVHLDLAESRLL